MLDDTKINLVTGYCAARLDSAIDEKLIRKIVREALMCLEMQKTGFRVSRHDSAGSREPPRSMAELEFEAITFIRNQWKKPSGNGGFR